MAGALEGISFRPLTMEDIGRVPVDCQGEARSLAERTADLGAAAILAFDGDQHVAQLQFRRHVPGLRSAKGVFSPDYWGDFGGREPALPERTLCIYCYHVGQLGEGAARDPRYQGRGLGAALLDELIDWATANRFEAMVAKAMPADPGVMQFMGGQPARVYAAKGFRCLDGWTDHEMYKALVERDLAPKGAAPEDLARVELWARHMALRP